MMKPEDAYKRLMDCLDDVEEKRGWKRVAVETLVLTCLTAALVASLTVERLKQRRVLELTLWHWVTMATILVSGLLGVRVLTRAVTWPVTRGMRTHKYAVYFVRRLKRSVDVTLWLCLVLFWWYVWFRPKIMHSHGHLSEVLSHQLTRLLIALCVGSFMWLLKGVLYLKLEADLHYDQLFDRIRETVVHLHGIQIIHTMGMWKFLTDSCNKTKLRKMMRFILEALIRERKMTTSDNELTKGVNVWIEVSAMKRESAPIWILQRLSEEFLDNIQMRPLPGSTNLIQDEQELLEEAKEMFKQLKHKRLLDPNDEIEREDLMRLYNLSKEELECIFRRRKDESSNRDRPIGHAEFLAWVVRGLKNCWGLERIVNSWKRGFIKLNRLLSTFLAVLVLIIWLLLSQIVTTAQLALLFSPFLAASFIFGDCCKRMFDGLIFAFAIHPFDVGDRVVIDNVQMKVTEMKILTSIFSIYGTGEEVIIPNSTLASARIINLDITPDQTDKVDFSVSSMTPLEDIKDFEIKILKLFEDDVRYSPNTKVVKTAIGKEEHNMTVYFKYVVCHLTEEAKAVHKSEILSMIMRFRNEMETNKKAFPTSHKPYIVDIGLPNKLKLDDIDNFKTEIISGLEQRYRPHSKVVTTELYQKKRVVGTQVVKTRVIRMALYASDHSGSEGSTKNYDDEGGREELGPNSDEEMMKKIQDNVGRLAASGEVRVYGPADHAYGGSNWAKLAAKTRDTPPTSAATSMRSLHNFGFGSGRDIAS